jgi:DHA2 family multidrug resistance protein
MAFLFVPINSSILSQFKGMELGQVSGLLNLSRQIGGSIGIALVGTLLTTKSAQNYLDIVSHVSMLDPQTQVEYLQAQGGMTSKMIQTVGQGTARDAALKSLSGRVHAQVFMLSFNQLMFTISLIFSLSFIPLIRLKLRSRPGGPVAAH